MRGHTTGGRPPGARPAPGARRPGAARVGAVLSIFLVAGVMATSATLARARGAPGAAAAAEQQAVGAAEVTRLLAGVRGVNPVACELALRAVDGRGNWFGRFGAAPGAVDTAAQGLVHDVINGALGPEVIPPLRDALVDADPCVRRVAAPLLARVDAPGGVQALVSALRASAAGTREAAAIGLGFAGRRRADVEPGGAAAALVSSLRDAEVNVRSAAAWALGRLEARDAVPALIAALRDAHVDVRESAAGALGEIEDPRAVEPLATALRGDADARVRRAAAWALGQIK